MVILSLPFFFFFLYIWLALSFKCLLFSFNKQTNNKKGCLEIIVFTAELGQHLQRHRGGEILKILYLFLCTTSAAPCTRKEKRKTMTKISPGKLLPENKCLSFRRQTCSD